jgi:DNA polymerase-3 subunit delta
MNEEQLNAELKQNIIRRVYLLHGKEVFLVGTYANRIIEKCLGGSEPDPLNYVRFSGNDVASDMTAFAESVETLPVFADKKIVALNDLDIEKLDEASFELFLTTLSRVEEDTCVLIFQTGATIDLRKSNTKKLISCIEKLSKNGAVLNFEKMTELKTAELISKRVERMGCRISKECSAILAKLCLRNLTLIANELDKLCAYHNYEGEITKKSIELLTARQLESSVFALATEITSKRGANAMSLLDELIEQGNHPVVIMSSLSLAFIDFYRAKLGSTSGKPANQIVKDFEYAANRSWVVGKAISASSRLTATQTRECVRVLCDADYKLKSSPISDRIIMERAIARLLSLC